MSASDLEAQNLRWNEGARRLYGYDPAEAEVKAPHRDPSANPMGSLLISRDIFEEVRLTEALKATQYCTRSLSEQQRRESESCNRGLIEASLHGLITVDSPLAISDVNKTMRRVSGYTRDGVTGSPFRPPNSPTPGAPGAGSGSRWSRGMTNDESILGTRQGQERLVSLHVDVFKDQDGHVPGIFASAPAHTELAGQ